MWHWTKDELGVAVQSCLWMQVELMAWEFSRLERLNGIKWSWVQFPHRPTFYSYFQESVSDEYHMYIYINVSRIIEQLWIYYLKFHDFTWRSWKKHETLSSKFIAVLFILLRSYILSAVNELQLFIIWYIYIYIYIYIVLYIYIYCIYYIYIYIYVLYYIYIYVWCASQMLEISKNVLKNMLWNRLKISK